MSPLLSSDQQPALNEDYKFVRDGDVIAFDNWRLNHSDIAQKYNLGEKIKGDAFRRWSVDDGGWIHSFVAGVIHVDSSTSTCQLRGPAQEARSKTCALVEQITGKKVERR